MEPEQWVAIGIAVLALIGSIIAAAMSALTSKRTAYFTARSARFAEWQMYKRRVYAEFLAAARHAAADPSTPPNSTLSEKFDSARLAAGTSLRIELERLYDTLSDTSLALSSRDLEAHIRAVSDVMLTDISTEPARRKSRA